MSDTLVVLWRRCDESHELCCEIVQIAEGYFELVVLDDDRVWLREASDDVCITSYSIHYTKLYDLEFEFRLMVQVALRFPILQSLPVFRIEIQFLFFECFL